MSTPSNTMELYDLHPLWHIPFWQTVYFYFIIGLICFVLLFSIFVLLALRYRKKTIHKKEPWERAIAQLEEIQKIKCSNQFNGRLCYFAITAVLKRYFHEMQCIDTSGKTDREFITYLKDTHTVSDQIIKNLDEIYKGCVLIRFANQEVIEYHLEKSLQLSINIIKETIPQDKNLKKPTFTQQ